MIFREVREVREGKNESGEEKKKLIMKQGEKAREGFRILASLSSLSSLEIIF